MTRSKTRRFLHKGRRVFVGTALDKGLAYGYYNVYIKKQTA